MTEFIETVMLWMDVEDQMEFWKLQAECMAFFVDGHDIFMETMANLCAATVMSETW